MVEEKLVYRAVTLDTLESVIMMETLLDRIIGESYVVVEKEDEGVYSIRFWSTGVEMERISELFNEEILSDLDDEYKELLKTS